MNILMIRICGHISGAEVYNLILLKELVKNSNFKFSFITNLSQFAIRISEFGVDVVCSPVLGREVGTKKDLLKISLWLPLYWIIYYVYIRKLERVSKFDLICLQSMTEKIFLTPLLRIFGYKVLWIEHGPLFVTSRTLFIKILYKFSSLLSHKIIAVSKDTKEDLVKGGVDGGIIQFIPIGIDTDFFKPFTKAKINQIKKNWKIQSSCPVITFVGFITKEKGIIEFMKTSEYLIKHNIEIRFLVVGEGPMLDWAKAEVVLMNSESKYIFTGFVNDVRNFLGISDILMFLSRHDEGTSISLLEALSMGVLVMASNKRGNLELIQNMKTGYILDDLINKKVAAQIIRALNYPENYSKIKINARNIIIERYNIIKQAREFAALFTSYET